MLFLWNYFFYSDFTAFFPLIRFSWTLPIYEWIKVNLSGTHTWIWWWQRCYIWITECDTFNARYMLSLREENDGNILQVQAENRRGGKRRGRVIQTATAYVCDIVLNLWWWWWQCRYSIYVYVYRWHVANCSDLFHIDGWQTPTCFIMSIWVSVCVCMYVDVCFWHLVRMLAPGCTSHIH